MGCDGKDGRIGRAFGNPDHTSDHYYSYHGVKNFGLVVTPDELRYQYAFGNELASTTGYEYTDDMLLYYIDRAIASIEVDLSHKIIGTVYRHRPPLHGTERIDINEEKDSFHWLDLYDFNKRNFKEYVALKLRHKPIHKLLKWHLFDVGTGNTLIDLTPWAKLNHGTGYLRAYPRAGKGLYIFPMVGPMGGFAGQGLGLYPASFDTYPSAYGLDYIAGYGNASEVPYDIVNVIGMLAAINLLSDYGDGITAGLANASISLSGISESYGTTMSATSAWFGARIKDYTDRITEWMKENKRKYRGFKFRII